MADEPHDQLSSVIFTAFGPRGSAHALRLRRRGEDALTGRQSDRFIGEFWALIGVSKYVSSLTYLFGKL